jgi:hypothetical protein
MTKFCRFYADTADGRRCVLQPPEKFILRPECYREGRGCEILAGYLQLRARLGPGPSVGSAGPAPERPRPAGTLLDYM